MKKKFEYETLEIGDESIYKPKSKEELESIKDRFKMAKEIMKKKSIDKRLLEVTDLALQAFNEEDNYEKVGEIYHALKDIREDMVKVSNTANEKVLEAHHKDRWDERFLLQETDKAFEYLQEELRYDSDEGGEV